MEDEVTHRRGAAAKFLLCSFFGIFMFFIQINVGGTRSIPVDHLISWLKSVLQDGYIYLLLVISACSVAGKILEKQRRDRRRNRFFFVPAFLGLLICCSVLTGIGGEKFTEAGKFAVNATGNILCAIFAASLFIPFLTEYGLVEAAGILCRPFMRKIFLTPGSSAVIGVSAFLGNYSMGHILARQKYEEGRFTEKESVIVALGFSTCSVGLMINLADYLDLMEHWTAYVTCIMLITFGVTALVSRIPPISLKKEVYREGTVPVREESEALSFRKAWDTGVNKAAGAPGFLTAAGQIFVRTGPVICEIAGTSIFVITVGMLAAAETDLDVWLGCLIRPLLNLAGGNSREVSLVSSAVGAGLLEPVLAGILCGGHEVSLRLRWVAGIVPYTAIVFFAGFVPSVCSSRIHCSVWEMLLLWAERVVLSTVFALLAAWILFG